MELSAFTVELTVLQFGRLTKVLFQLYILVRKTFFVLKWPFFAFKILKYSIISIRIDEFLDSERILFYIMNDFVHS